jgi:uncharacterized protein (UPF0332 family)
MNSVKDIVEYRLGQSEAAFKMALVALDIGDWNHVCNRLYYSAFYAVSAYVVWVNENAKTHNGAKSKFHSIFIKSGLVENKYGELYDLLFTNRQDADYTDFIVFTKEAVFPLIEETKSLLGVIKSYIKI